MALNLLFLLLLFVSQTSCADILGLGASDNVKDEYIILLNKESKDLIREQMTERVRQKLREALGLDSIKNSFEIGSYSLFNIKSELVEKLQNIGDMKEIQTVFANARIRAAPVIEEMDSEYQYKNLSVRVNLKKNAEAESVCYVQEIKNNGLWGLSRSVRRNRVGRDTEKYYSYLNGDAGHGVYVYVFDTGVNVNHMDFFNQRASFFYKATTISEDHWDHNGHGTHVAGSVGGNNFGSSKNVWIRSVKVLDKDGSGNAVGFLEGIQRVYNEYRSSKRKSVCNLSLGFDSIVQPIDDVIAEASAGGLTFVIAAGNSKEDACDSTPSRGNSVITVGATNINDQMASFSNYGTCVDILAPGEYILSAAHNHNEETKILSGTSMACPYVAGIVARHMQRTSATLSPAQVKTWLQEVASPDKIDLTYHFWLSSIKAEAMKTPNKLLYWDPCHEEADIAGTSIVALNVWAFVICIITTWMAILS